MSCLVVCSMTAVPRGTAVVSARCGPARWVSWGNRGIQGESVRCDQEMRAMRPERCSTWNGGVAVRRSVGGEASRAVAVPRGTTRSPVVTPGSGRRAVVAGLTSRRSTWNRPIRAVRPQFEIHVEPRPARGRCDGTGLPPRGGVASGATVFHVEHRVMAGCLRDDRARCSGCTPARLDSCWRRNQPVHHRSSTSPPHHDIGGRSTWNGAGRGSLVGIDRSVGLVDPAAYGRGVVRRVPRGTRAGPCGLPPTVSMVG